MLPQYTTIQGTDVEKQPLVGDYQDHGHSCPCRHQQQDQQGRGRNRPSKSTIAIFVLVLLLFVGYGRNICQKNHDHYSHSIQSNNMDTSSSVDSNDLRWCSRRPLTVDWQGKSVYEFGQEITSLSVEHSDEGHISTQAGEVVVVVNEKIEKAKVTFDIKLSHEHAQHAARIDEFWSDHALALNVVTNDHGHHGDCVKINVLIEVPSAAALEDLNIKFINNDITFKDKLELKDSLDVSTVSGDLLFKKPIASARKISFSVASGDIHGTFDVEQVDFSSTVVSGEMGIVFDRISSDSAIHASATSGNVKIQVPTKFESRFDISVVSGNADLRAKDAQKLHYRRSGGIVGHKVNGYYGSDESPSSKISLSAVSGNVELSYK